MEVMDELSFKILADGQQKIQINEFRDIDVELGFSEKKLQQSIPEKYSSIQTEFNSAELINSEKRTKYSVIAYELTEKELAVNLSGETEIENFISAYLNKYQNTTYGSISKLEIHLEDPCLLEMFEELLLTARYFLVSKLDDGKNPWEIKNFRSLDMKQKDIDTVVFFTIFYRYYFN